VHGGYGYTRDFPVEQYWRDNRLNMIHEGTHGIQALDLLGRKVRMEEGRGLELLMARVEATLARARKHPSLQEHADQLDEALSQIAAATAAAWATGEPTKALANAVPYMQAFGHTVLAWIWLDVAQAALAETSAESALAQRGRLLATQFFFRYELPKIGAWLEVVKTRDMTCAQFPEEAF
jgi:butyryl-CoA dehydrogenase